MDLGGTESLWIVALKLVVMFVFLDFVFYWQHRTLHIPWLYKRFHKQHHEFYATVGFAHAYAGLVESIFVNGAPFIIAVWVVRQVFGTPMHLSHMMLYEALRLWETIDAHSGYEFPWSPW